MKALLRSYYLILDALTRRVMRNETVWFDKQETSGPTIIVYPRATTFRYAITLINVLSLFLLQYGQRIYNCVRLCTSFAIIPTATTTACSMISLLILRCIEEHPSLLYMVYTVHSNLSNYKGIS